MNKFERGQDPKKSLGIGLFSNKYFAEPHEVRIFLLQNFTKILGIDYLPDPFPSKTQWNELASYAEKYLFLDNIHLSENEAEAALDNIKEFYRDLHEVRNLGKKYGIRER